MFKQNFVLHGFLDYWLMITKKKQKNGICLEILCSCYEQDGDKILDYIIYYTGDEMCLTKCEKESVNQ